MAFGLLMLGFLFGFLRISADMEPAYGLPKSYFGIVPSWASYLDMLPMLMVILSIAMVAFTVGVWRNGVWRLAERVHYTLVTMATVALLAIFSAWNVL